MRALVAIGGYWLSNVAVGLVMLIIWYPAAWIVGPIVGTTIIAGGLKSMAHARAMDAQRRGNPGGTESPPGQ